MALQTDEKAEIRDANQPGWNYSDASYRMFPRYRLAQAIQVEVERIIPTSVESLDEMGQILLQATQIPEERLKSQLNNPIASNALLVEAKEYRTYIRQLTGSDLGAIDPLPYRRVLSTVESEHLWELLRTRWGVGDDHHWFPLREGDPPSNVVAFHEDFFSLRQGAELLRQALAERGIKRVFQLSEFYPSDPDYEIEVSILEPIYAGGGEQYFTPEAADWLVYASHESSITIAGDWLMEYFAKAWPDWRARTYQGPYATPDLRGTWETK